MNYNLRFFKAYERSHNAVYMSNKYYDWLVSKPPRYRASWTNMFGRNRACLDHRLAGYIGRHRQIEKCFMKGWF